MRASASAHALALIVALGTAIRFATIGSGGFWLDEEVTVSLVQQGPIDLLKGVVAGESNPPLYYLLQGAWERVFGSGELGIRSLSALVGAATIPLMYGAGKALLSRRAGLIAAALTATSPLLIWYSQEARSYELLVLFAALTLFCFARALNDAGHRWIWGWGLACALALATHYFAVFLIAGEAVWLLARRPRARLDTGLAIATVGAVGLALLPLVATQRGRGDWIDDYSLSGRLLNVPEHFLVGYQVPGKILPTLAIAAFVIVGAFAAMRVDDATRRAMAVVASIAAGGFALILLAVAAGSDYVLSRNLLELWPAAALAIAVGLAAPRLGRAGIALTAMVCALGAGLAIWNGLTPAAGRPNYEQVAEALEDSPKQRLIVSQSSFSSPLILYSDRIRAASDAELAATELVVVEQRPERNYAVGTCFWIDTCGGEDVEPPPRFEPPPGFELARTEATDSFELAFYTAAERTAIERPTEYFTPRVFVQEPG
jgi:mannosyltransferase